MSPKTKTLWYPFLSLISDYLLGLKNQEGARIVFTQKKIGFFGMVCNVHSLEQIFSINVENGDLSFLSTYKFSQDFLEHFFGLMRVKFGCTNNPNLVSFRGIYRKILAGITDIVIRGSNVGLQDEAEMVGVTPSLNTKVEVIASKFEINDDIYYDNLLDLSLYKNNVVEYMSGYVIRRAIAQLNCDECIRVLKTKPHKHMSLISLRDYGEKLFYPSDFANKVMVLSEKIVSFELKGNVLSKKFSFDKIVLRIVSDFVNCNASLIRELDEHGYALCKKLVLIYVCIRMKHHARMTNIQMKNNNLRSKLNRICVNKKL